MLKLTQIKDFFAVLKLQKEIVIAVSESGKINPISMLENLSEEIINELCAIVTGERKNYADDMIDAADILAGFFLNLKEQWDSKPNLKKLGGFLAGLQMYLR